MADPNEQIADAVEQAISEVETVAEEIAADAGLASAAADAESSSEGAVIAAETAIALTNATAAELEVAARMNIETLHREMNEWRQEADRERQTLSLDLTTTRAELLSLTTALQLIQLSLSQLQTTPEIVAEETTTELPLPSDVDVSQEPAKRRHRLI